MSRKGMFYYPKIPLSGHLSLPISSNRGGCIVLEFYFALIQLKENWVMVVMCKKWDKRRNLSFQNILIFPFLIL